MPHDQDTSNESIESGALANCGPRDRIGRAVLQHLRAETIAVDDQVTVASSDVNCPGRGMTMKTVEAKFGAPQERHEAVGQPPISRWDYPTFSVFFEHEYVIHSVVNAGQ